MLYGQIGYHDWEGLSLTLEERDRLSKNMEGNRVLVMRNHGFLTVGETAGEASNRQYDHFPLGKHEWPALCRLMDQIDPSYRQ